jgi:hypothetical protein
MLDTIHRVGTLSPLARGVCDVDTVCAPTIQLGDSAGWIDNWS